MPQPARRLSALRTARLAAGFSLAIAGLSAVAPRAFAASPSRPLSVKSALASDLARQPDAEAAETWLAQNIPDGATLGDFPDFFAAAHEAFFDAQENRLVFVYRSAAPGRWVAWVSFDGERNGVVDTIASDL